MPATNSTIQQILSDIDGTIYPMHGPLPQYFHTFHEQLSRLIWLGNQGQGPCIGFCTGREINYVIGATKSLETSNCWTIVENGNFLYNLATGERQDHPYLTPEIRKVFYEIRCQMPDIASCLPGLVLYDRKEINFAFERRDPDIDLAENESKLREALATFARYIDVTNSGLALDVTVKGVHKGSGVLRVSEHKQISPKQLLVIGDSKNDLPAMEIAGFIGCPSNAQDECKKYVQSKGGYISHFPVVIGVVDIINHFLSMVKQDLYKYH